MKSLCELLGILTMLVFLGALLWATMIAMSEDPRTGVTANHNLSAKPALLIALIAAASGRIVSWIKGRL